MNNKLITLDIETSLATAENPLQVPVCVQTFDGEYGCISKDVIGVMTSLLEDGYTLYAHNAGFDFGVYLMHAPQMKHLVHKRVFENKVICTMQKEKLLHLSTNGNLNAGRFSLAALTQKYLGTDRTEEKEDANSWRLRYVELLDVEIEDWPEESIDYAITDVIDLHTIAQHQIDKTAPKGPSSSNTLPLQTMSAIILQQVSITGIQTDTKSIFKLREEIESQVIPARNYIVEKGYGVINEKTGKFEKKTKLLKEYLEDLYPDYLQKTKPSSRHENGQTRVGKDQLLVFPQDDLIDNFITYSEHEKILSTFLPQLEKSISHNKIHPNFNTLVETGRMSSWTDKNLPSMNAQQPPRKKGVRECFIPRKGHKFVSIDYSTVELRRTAQKCFDLFGESQMMESINAGYDLHSVLASKIMGIEYDQFMTRLKNGDEECASYRQMAKPINLSYPGGVGPLKMIEIARKGYDVRLTLQEARNLRDLFFGTFPEVRMYLKEYMKTQKTGQRWDNERKEHVDLYGYSSSSRYRANCTYCSMSNGDLMQSLVSDGFKDAMIQIYLKHGNVINVPFHDEFLLELPLLELIQSIESISHIMIESMSKVLPDVRIGVEASIMKGPWTKEKEGIEQTLTYDNYKDNSND